MSHPARQHGQTVARVHVAAAARAGGEQRRLNRRDADHRSTKVKRRRAFSLYLCTLPSIAVPYSLSELLAGNGAIDGMQEPRITTGSMSNTFERRDN